MKFLSEEERASADMVLAPPIPVAQSAEYDLCEDESLAANAAWQLPFHSLLVSGMSAPLAASITHAASAQGEKAEDGKGVLRLPLTQNAGARLLQFCYRALPEYEPPLSLAETIQLAMISHVQKLPGKSFCLSAIASKTQDSVLEKRVLRTCIMIL